MHRNKHRRKHRNRHRHRRRRRHRRRHTHKRKHRRKRRRRRRRKRALLTSAFFSAKPFEMAPTAAVALAARPIHLPTALVSARRVASCASFESSGKTAPNTASTPAASFFSLAAAAGTAVDKSAKAPARAARCGVPVLALLEAARSLAAAMAASGEQRGQRARRAAREASVRTGEVPKSRGWSCEGRVGRWGGG